MGQRFIEILSQKKVNQLFLWRKRYSKPEYPYKVALNLLYEMLVCERMWTEIQRPFNHLLFNSDSVKFKNFQEAHKYIIDLSNEIARKELVQIVESEYHELDSIAGLNWRTIREHVSKAQKGDNEEVQEIELTYYFYTCGIELIYAWAALGYLGINQEIAFSSLTGMIIGGVDYSSYPSLLHHFGLSSTWLYNPLPKLF